MKTIPIIGITLLAACAASAQTTIFDHTFDGSGAAPLNGTAEDFSGELWSVNGPIADADYIYADGSAIRGAGMLAYTFTSGTYELTSSITAGSLTGIGFSDSATATENRYYSRQWGTFGLRNTGDFEFFEGIANNNPNDGGNLTDYGLLVTQTTGTLRLVLDWDDTTNVGTVVGYYTPSGGSEVQIDLDDQTPGVNGNTISPGADLLGVGITSQGGSYQTFTMTSIPESSSFSFVGGILALVLGLYYRRKMRANK